MMARNSLPPASIDDIRSRISSVPGQNFAWKDSAQELSEESIVLLDQSQDVRALRRQAVLCKTKADTIKGPRNARPAPAAQLAADALVHLATHLETRAARLEGAATQAQQVAPITPTVVTAPTPAPAPVSVQTSAPTQAPSGAKPTPTPTSSVSAPVTSTVTSTKTVPQLPITSTEGAPMTDPQTAAAHRNTLAGVGPNPSVSDPNAKIVVDPSLTEISPLTDDEQLGVVEYLRKPIEHWTFSDRSEVYGLCYARENGNPRRTGSSDRLADLYNKARELRLKRLKDLASPAITAYFLDRHCAEARDLLGVNEPSREPEGKVTDPDELQIHRRWMAFLISDKRKRLNKQEMEWIKKNGIHLPPSMKEILEARMRQELDPAGMPGAQTANLAAVAQSGSDLPAQQTATLDHTTEPPPAEPKKSTDTDDRSLTVPKKPFDPIIVIALALTVIAVVFVSYKEVTRSHLSSTRMMPPSARQAPAMVSTNPARPTVASPPVPAVIAPPVTTRRPATSSAAQPPTLVVQLRPLQAADVHVTDLRHVRDGQIPFSLRLEHMRCATPPRRNTDNTVDFSTCQWMEMRPVRR